MLDTKTTLSPEEYADRAARILAEMALNFPGILIMHEEFTEFAGRLYNEFLKKEN